MNTEMSEDRLGEIYELAKESYIFRYGDYDSEAVIITSVGCIQESEHYFYGEGTISGNAYTIWYEEINLRTDKFYKLAEVELS